MLMGNSPLLVQAAFSGLTHTHSFVLNSAMCRNTVSEGIDGKTTDLFEEMGVDTDEAVGVGLEYTRLELLLPSKKQRKL